MKQIIPFLFFISPPLFAGGIKGTIKAEDGTTLPYASIYVKQTGLGATTDQNGYYELPLDAGHYEVIFKYLGYEASLRTVDISKEFIELDVVLKEQNILLQGVTVTAGKEDPAYTIMRKAIAKAKFHTQQLDSYTAKVYIKGKGKLRDYPWLAKKMLEKEGITKDRLFITESVNEIKYTRPNKYEQKVIAVYTQGKDRDTSPNQYFFGSFYAPEIAETVSPLSPKAFAYYKFEYLGTFKDAGYEVSKIKVTPRSKGDNVFEGTIFIVENWWSIHSLELIATKLGIHFKVKQIYQPIEDMSRLKDPLGQAWMPVSQEAIVSGKVFGFDFVGSYHATVKEYKIKLNPALIAEVNLIDEKLEKDEAKKIKKQFNQKNQQIQQRLEKGKEITNKELRQLTRAYEKAEQQQQKEPDVISESKYSVDSTAYKKDSTFWANIRPAPLDKEEIRGYKKTDSLSQVQRKREEGDTLKSKKHKGFHLTDIVTGNGYKINKNSNFVIHAPWGGYNTVEGVNAIYRLSLYRRWVKKDTLHPERRPETKRLEISPTFRYAFAREKLTGFLRADYRTRTARVTLSGGRYIQQFNSDEPIHPLVNTFTTLFQGQNWMKLYEREFIDLNFRKSINDKYLFRTQWSLAQRHELFNNNNYSFNDNSRTRFTLNAPVNIELPNTNFAQHTAFIGSIGFEARPWQKYRISNGYKYRADRSSPTLTLDYKKGFSQVFGSDVDYDLLEVGFKESLRTGITGRLDLNLKAGKFLNARSMYFMDYKHFAGNETPFITSDPVGSFRLLPYYTYSTHDQYFSANVHYHFRKFLITRIPKVRLLGVSENFFVNYLATPVAHNYTELGYGVNGILRLFRLEFATAFQNGTYINNGFRIGISTNLMVTFSDN
ncbi:MAG: carboxypeptidase-like regulatory domain-containing protein [Bacteroidetes bacterium]|nr:carboxypeptidase-like regulatory domain-containing protein [Bacteroidota bacterium]MBS1540645.1 carboxypeptidase-like regulatory domain-containing protein [Bacteroidota bacterium]